MKTVLKATIVLGLVAMETNGETLVRKHQNSLDLATNGHATQQRSIEVDASGNVESSDYSVDSTLQLSPSLVGRSMKIDAVGNVEILDHSPSLVRKSMKDAAVESGSSAEFQKHGPYPLQRNVLDYFKHWSNGNIAHQLKTTNSSGGGAQAWLQKETNEQFRSASGLLGLLRTTSMRTCVKSSRTFDGDAKLYKSTGDPDDVFHALLVLPDGALQYAAVSRGTVMAAEPSLCQIAKKDDDLDDGDGDQESGESHLLDIESDPTVRDCGDLFARTVQQQCGTSFEFDVISASEHVIDGIEIEMNLKVTEGTSEYFHTVSCDFEIPWGDQTSQTGQTQLLPEEAEGLVATLVFQGSLCEANQRSTSSQTDSLKLMQSYPLGEISFFKGNEWMRTLLPLTRVSLESSTPSSYDMRASYPVCFPGSGYTGPVRNQGNCGSCWAFASATAAMTTLCTKHNGRNETVTGGTRYEISTQQIMSCNSYKYGCKGGNAYGANVAWQSKGLFKERDFSYMCGHGSALDHFDSGTSCTAWPWGKNCPSSGAYSYWRYSGMSVTSGEAGMKQKIAEGVGMYVSFKVYNNFFGYSSGIYSSSSGDYKGGHAVVPVGYGTSSGTKFWTLQNSWGSGWGSNGYFNMKRGTNLCQIESFAAYYDVSSTAPTRRRRRRRDRRRRDRRRRDCFPSAAKVYAKDYGHVRIDSLQQGALILSADESGRIFYDEVSFYSLADPERKHEAFLAVGTSTNRVIRITGAHHLPVGPECCGNLKIAKELRVGDLIWTVEPGDQTATLDTVKFIEKVVDDGMHSPVMLKGGHPVVDGVVTSFDDVDSINMAARWMPVLARLCTAANICGTTATMIKKYECFAKGECGHREVIKAATHGASITRQTRNDNLVV